MYTHILLTKRNKEWGNGTRGDTDRKKGQNE